jgi:hypothetical protein
MAWHRVFHGKRSWVGIVHPHLSLTSREPTKAAARVNLGAVSTRGMPWASQLAWLREPVAPVQAAG